MCPFPSSPSPSQKQLFRRREKEGEGGRRREKEGEGGRRREKEGEGGRRREKEGEGGRRREKEGEGEGGRKRGGERWKKKMDMPGFDPGTFRMLSGRDTNFATRPVVRYFIENYKFCHNSIVMQAFLLFVNYQKKKKAPLSHNLVY